VVESFTEEQGAFRGKGWEWRFVCCFLERPAPEGLCSA